jgi:hypothetical protein
MSKLVKGKILGHPFLGYKGYKIWHKGEGRFYVCLVPLVDGLKRTTITLAKYKLSRHFGRRLSKHEQADHIDGDKSNDRLANLQILTQKQNRNKQQIELGISAKWRTLKCPNCGVKFKRKAHRVDFKLQQGLQPCCSRRCGGQYSRR